MDILYQRKWYDVVGYLPLGSYCVVKQSTQK